MLSVYTVAVVAIGLHITHRERNVKLLLPVANETKSSLSYRLAMFTAALGLLMPWSSGKAHMSGLSDLDHDVL